MLENPASRESGVAYWEDMQHRCAMWHMPAMLRLVEQTGAATVTFAQCQFSSEYQKYTSLLSSAAAAPSLRKAFAHAICTCSSHAKVAKGRDEFGESLSAPAAEYSRQGYAPCLPRALGLAPLVASEQSSTSKMFLTISTGWISGPKAINQQAIEFEHVRARAS